MRLGTHQRDDVRRQMAGQSGAEARRRAESLAKQYDCSVGTVYAITRDVRPGRQRRVDAGHADEISDQLREKFIFLTIGKGLSTTRARNMLVREGHELPSVPTLNRLRRQHGLTRRDLASDARPGVRFEASRPNRLWQIDSSGSLMFYQDLDGSVVYESPLKRTKNKPDRVDPRIWFVAIIDDHSRALWAEIVPANDTRAWLTAFGNAAREKGSEFPFCGLPDEVYVDNDAVVKSVRFGRIMRMFSPPVEIRKALPYIGKRSKGKVERVIRTIKEDFEAVHSAAEVPHLAQVIDQSHHKPTRWRSLEEANEHLVAWLLEYNNRAHSTTGVAPFRRWMAGATAENLRVVSEDILNGYLRMDSREASIQRDLCVSINRVRYALPHSEPFVSMVGRKITIWWSPTYADAVFADVEGSSYEIHPVGQPLEVGEFKAIPYATREKMKLEVAKAPDVPVEQPKPDQVTEEAPKYLTGRPSVADVPDAPPPMEVMRSRTQALIWLTEKKHFHKPVRELEHAALDELMAGREQVEFAELQRWAHSWRENAARKANVA